MEVRRQKAEGFRRLLAQLDAKTITEEEAAELTRRLLDDPPSVQDEEGDEAVGGQGGHQRQGKRQPDKRTQRPPRELVHVDGLGTGAKQHELRSVLWRGYTPGPGSDPLPTTVEGARVWLKNPKNTGNCYTTQFRSHDKRIIRRCVHHPAVLHDGVPWHCGVMWRMDASTGWAPQVRVADEKWAGEHLPEVNEDVKSKRRVNSIFDSAQETHVQEELRKGITPKKIYLDMLNTVYDSLSEEVKNNLTPKGRKGAAHLLGFELNQMQKYAERYRLAAGNGFLIESLADLSVSVLLFECYPRRCYPNVIPCALLPYVIHPLFFGCCSFSSCQEWMAMHALPVDPEGMGGLLPTTTYVVTPPRETLGLSWIDKMHLEIAACTTKEMMASCHALVKQLELQGFTNDGVVEIAVDVDGKRKVVRNGWTVVTLGWRSIHMPGGSTEWRQTFTPFVALVCPTETHVAFMYGTRSIEHAYHRLYKKTIRVFGQNTDSHTSAHKCAKELDYVYSTLCYAHIKRAPADKKQRHMIRGSQDAKDAFLDTVAGPDVEKLHLCQTTKQARMQTLITTVNLT
jgi:hypothetical protein